MENIEKCECVIGMRNDYENTDLVTLELWEEKIGDSINYLLLLTALIHEQKGD